MSINKSGTQNAGCLCPKAATVLRAGLILVLLACLLTACATMAPTIPPAPVPVKRPMVTQPLPSIEQRIGASLKNFEIIIRTENAGIGPGPDGKNVPYLGRDAAIQMILRFQDAVDESIGPHRFTARIGHLPFPFIKQISNREFLTDMTQLTSIPSGLNIGPSGVSLFYKDRELKSSLSKGTVAIDTSPPPRAENIKVKTCSPEHYVLAWESEKGDIREYRVQKWDSGRWAPIRSGIGNPPVRIDAEPKGRIRVVAVDYALNRTISEEIDIEERCTVDLRVDVQALRYNPSSERYEELRRGDILRTDDRVNLKLIASRESYVYVINIDGSGRTYPLFPRREITTGNPVPSYPALLLPGRSRSGEQQYYRVDEATGDEYVYVLAYLEPDRELESLMAEMTKKQGADITQRFRSHVVSRGMGNIESDDSFGSQGDYRDSLEKRVDESLAAKKYRFLHN